MANDEPKINQLGEKIKKLKEGNEYEQKVIVQTLMAMPNLSWSIGLSYVHSYLICSELCKEWCAFYLKTLLPQISKK